RPDRERGGADPLPLEWRLRLPDRDPSAVWRRHPRRAVSLPVTRDDVRAHPRPEGARAGYAARRAGAAQERNPRRRPGAVLRAQEALSLVARATVRRRPARPDRPGAHRPGRRPADNRDLRLLPPDRAPGG